MEPNIKKHKIILKSVASMALTGLWLACPNHLNAQNSANELSVTVGGASSSLDYDAGDAQVKDGLGVNFGLDYTHYFSESFGIGIGAEYQRMEATASIEQLSGAYNAVDYEQESFEFRYRMARIEEKQKIGFINIPLTFIYRNQEYGFYVRAGAKVGLPISGKFEGEYSLGTSGYYPQYNGELFDPAFMGFGNFGRVKANGSTIDLKPSYIATLELGIVEPIGKGNFYGGFYIDYGLNDIADKNSNPVEYTVNESGAGFTYNSILNSGHVENIKTIAFGVKLRYSFLNF